MLKACVGYLENVLQHAPVGHAIPILPTLRFLPNKLLIDLCQRAQQTEFDFVEPKHEPATA
ncbi:hypothetical protein ACFS7Z_25040 [Pontibacter toksunensis]|uniref:Uncharacterized protein n=1 Tax=Pontibacter toksunensis TaxID=1332631 RepID=A0ABW6C2L9_9BACT